MFTTSISKSERPNGVDSRELMLTERDLFKNEKATGAAQRRVHVLDHPLSKHAITALRDQHSSSEEFRYYSHLLLVLLAIEATRTQPTRSSTVEATWGTATGELLSKPIVFLSLSRHSLGMSHQIGDFIPDLVIGSITLDHSSDCRVEPRLHLANAPALNEALVILFDPVVGSGLSAGIALNLIRKIGATNVALISFLMSAIGVQRVQTAAPEAEIWTGAIDNEYDSKKGPLPGFGNFGQRLYQDERAPKR